MVRKKMNKKVFWKGFLKVITILSAGIVGGYLALVLVHALPIGRVRNKKK